MIRRYSDLRVLETFNDRFDYLKLHGEVCAETFGFNRILNQQFYRSPEWRRVRNEVIMRDNGCDLGIEGYDLDRIYIHHMNPITIQDIEDSTEFLLDPEFLICVSQDTHNAIHYGDGELIQNGKLIERKPNDTCPWR